MRRLTLILVLTAGLPACGGGGGGPRDGGTDRIGPDLRPIPDAPTDLAVPDADAAADVAPPLDAGPACDPASGQLTGGVCRGPADCRCPRVCLELAPAPATGSCWGACDPARTDAVTGANPDCLAAESCTAGGSGEGGCVPRGTLTGGFDVPVFTAPDAPASPAELGSTDLTLVVGLIGEMSFGAGQAAAPAGGAAGYRLTFHPGSGASIDWDKRLVFTIAADDAYAAGAAYDLAAPLPAATAEYHEVTRSAAATVTRDVLRARVVAGTLTLTAAGTGARAPVTGTLTGGVAVEVEAEVCGESSVACE